jgi:ketosteroid isomerase-like protein
MYSWIIGKMVRRTFSRLNAGDYDAVVRRFSPEARFRMHGDHALGGDRRGPEGAAAFFEESFRFFPGLRIEPQEVMVAGPPWNITVATRFKVRDTTSDYRNEGMQFLRIRWGRVVEDLIYEDTQKLAAALSERSAAEAPAARRP